MYIQFEIIKFHFYAIIGADSNIIGENLCLDIITKSLNSLLNFCIWCKNDLNTVCDFQTAILTDILHTVDNFTSHTLLLELIGEFDLKGNGQ